MKIEEVYKQYRVPRNLQEHMLRVAGLVCVMRDNWQGEEVDWDLVIVTSLVHDIGNLVKFDLDTYGDLISDYDIEYWRKVKADLVGKYGSDDHEVTRKIVVELGMGKAVLSLLDNRTFIKLDTSILLANMELNISNYVDFRIGPNGVLTLYERYRELKKRYEGNVNASINKPNAEACIAASYKIEKQIQESVSIDLQKVKDEEIEGYWVELKNWEV